MEFRVAAQFWNGPLEKFASSILGIRALHQCHPRAINRVLVVAVVELKLISDRPDLECCRNQQCGGQCDLSDHEKPRDDVDQPTAIPSPAFLHHLGCVAVSTD